MRLPGRKLLLANAACLLLLAWLYGGELRDALRARGADVSAFVEPPPLVRPAVVLALAALALGAMVWGMLRGRGGDFKGYRLLPLLLVGALFVDLVLVESRVPLGSTDLATMSLRYFHNLAQQQATVDGVPADAATLSPLLQKLGRPPYLVRGQPATQYTLQVRQDCEGPVGSAPGLQPGTFIYCVAPGRKGAWITLVGLPAEQRFGTPDILSVRGEPRFLLVQPARPEEEGGTLELFPAARDGVPGATEPPGPGAEGSDALPGP
jgi:hypothetical protein